MGATTMRRTFRDDADMTKLNTGDVHVAAEDFMQVSGKANAEDIGEDYDMNDADAGRDRSNGSSAAEHEAWPATASTTSTLSKSRPSSAGADA